MIRDKDLRDTPGFLEIIIGKLRNQMGKTEM